MKNYFTLKLHSIGYCLLLSFLWAAPQLAHTQTYVNHAATGDNDGTSWINAYVELADALDNYSAGDEIWVAAGTYLPQQPTAWTGDAKETFYLYQDVLLYGGFNGTETMLAQRDPATNVTGDDVADDFETNREDNVINVLYVEATVTTAATLDGFTVTGGHADINNGISPNWRGGGLFSWGAIQTSNCIFQQNYTIWDGGGICYSRPGAAGGELKTVFFSPINA